MTDLSFLDTKTLLERINDWLREPDYAEDFSLDEMIDWIERRPISAVATLTARSSADTADEIRQLRMDNARLRDEAFLRTRNAAHRTNADVGGANSSGDQNCK